MDGYANDQSAPGPNGLPETITCNSRILHHNRLPLLLHSGSVCTLCAVLLEHDWLAYLSANFVMVLGPCIAPACSCSPTGLGTCGRCHSRGLGWPGSWRSPHLRRSCRHSCHLHHHTA